MSNYKDFNLNDSKMDAIEELKKRMDGKMDAFEMYDQKFVFYRFLKARNWDVNKAELMLNKSVEHRKKINLEALIKDYQPPTVLKEMLANLHIGEDKEECQLYYIPIGRVDIKGLFKATKPNDIEKTTTQLFNAKERLLEKRSKELKRYLSGFVLIVDFTGITLTSITHRKGIETILRLFTLQQINAPERLKDLYFINVPSFCAVVINLIKNVLPFETVSKFHIFDEDGWQSELLKVINADQLPVFMGGTRTDPDGNPLCKTIINQFSKVDEKYYLVKNGLELANLPGVKKLHIPRASSSKLHLNIQESGSVIEWEFETETGDIAFGLWTGNTDTDGEIGELVELVPMERVDTKDYVESGLYTCEKPGYYCILFDNTYSWLRSKEIFYRIRVVKPCDLNINIKDDVMI